MRAWMPKNIVTCLKLCFWVSSVVAAAGLQNLRKQGRDGKKPSKTDFANLNSCFGVSMAFSGGFDILWFLVFGKELALFSWKTFQTRGVDDRGASKAKL